MPRLTERCGVQVDCLAAIARAIVDVAQSESPHHGGIRILGPRDQRFHQGARLLEQALLAMQLDNVLAQFLVVGMGGQHAFQIANASFVR